MALRSIFFPLSAERKMVGLFKGEMWLAILRRICLLWRTGRFVKNPTVFFKKVEFVRDYAIQDGNGGPAAHGQRD